MKMIYRISPSLLWWLILTQIVALVPHVMRMPIWVFLVMVLSAYWRLMVCYGRLPMPERVHVYLLSISTIVCAYFHFETFFARELYITLLALAFCLKLLELKAMRDSLLIIFIGYFLIAANFLYDQSLLMVIFLILSFLLYTFVLIGLNRIGDISPAKKVLKQTIFLFIQALPIIVLLFVFFPRNSDPLFNIGDGANQAKSGFGQPLTPGTLSNVARSDDLVFRAKFIGKQPRQEDLYWRGLTMSLFDGMSWTPMVYPKFFGPPSIQAIGEPYHYTLNLEPMDERWIFALDLPFSTPKGTSLTADRLLLANKPYHHPLQLTLTSYPNYKILDKMSDWELSANTQLPGKGNLKSREFAKKLYHSLDDDTAKFINAILTYFSKNNFYYTLSPPLINYDFIDGFLFGTQKGFCEHYASSFVFLMRAAGIPARIVTGYLGGEFNPITVQWSVKQFHAHAWAEVWTDKSGWIRIDPTLAVAPERAFEEIPSVYQEQARKTGIIIPGWASQYIEENIAKDLEWLWQMTNDSWKTIFLDYTSDRQKEMLAIFGLQNMAWWQLLSILILIIFTIIFLFGIISFTKRQRYEKDPVIRAYNHVCTKLERIGIVRTPHEPAHSFYQRAIIEKPELADALKLITDEYIQQRYAKNGEANPKKIRKLSKQLNWI